MKFLLLITLAVLAVVVAGNNDDHDKAWKSFKVKFGKMFLSKNTENERKSNFIENYQTVQSINEKFAKGELKYEADLYPHSDLTKEEFLARKTGFRVTNKNSTVRKTLPILRQSSEEFDLRPLGALNPVRNQGSCGSCWTFSTTAAMESSHFMTNGQSDIPTLAEQHLLDCVYPRDGCQGGFMNDAFEWIRRNNGQGTPDTYGIYTGRSGSCKPVHGSVSVNEYFQIDADPEQIKQAVQQYGALAIAVDASDWGHYRGGVFSTGNYGNLNHAVNLVGYGSDNGEDFWIVRNSWGPGWGENGYIRISTSESGTYNQQFTFAVHAS